jgi:hypothetical protein
MNHLKDSIVSVVDPATQVKVSVEPVRTSPLDGVAWIVGLLGTGANERIKNTLIWTYIDSLRLFASRGKQGRMRHSINYFRFSRGFFFLPMGPLNRKEE